MKRTVFALTAVGSPAIAHHENIGTHSSGSITATLAGIALIGLAVLAYRRAH